MHTTPKLPESIALPRQVCGVSCHLQQTYCQVLPPGIGPEGLRLQDKHSSRPKVAVDLPEQSLQPVIPPVQVDPLGKAEAQDDIILRSNRGESVVCFRKVVSLKQRQDETCNSPLTSNVIISQSTHHPYSYCVCLLVYMYVQSIVRTAQYHFIAMVTVASFSDFLMGIAHGCVKTRQQSHC